MDGNLDTPAINELITTLHKSDDLAVKALSNRVIKMIELLGGVVKENKILHIDELDQDMLQALANGYVEGFDMAKADLKKAEKMEAGLLAMVNFNKL